MVQDRWSLWPARHGEDASHTERIRYLLETQPDLTGAEILGLTFTTSRRGNEASRGGCSPRTW